MEDIEILRDKNRNLKKELEIVKNRIDSSLVTESPRNNGNTQTTNSKEKDYRKDKRKDIKNGKRMTGGKRNSQPVVTSIERRNKKIKIRKESLVSF